MSVSGWVGNTSVPHQSFRYMMDTAGRLAYTEHPVMGAPLYPCMMSYPNQNHQVSYDIIAPPPPQNLASPMGRAARFRYSENAGRLGMFPSVFAPRGSAFDSTEPKPRSGASSPVNDNPLLYSLDVLPQKQTLPGLDIHHRASRRIRGKRAAPTFAFVSSFGNCLTTLPCVVERKISTTRGTTPHKGSISPGLLKPLTLPPCKGQAPLTL
jgi:hypothetical protein